MHAVEVIHNPPFSEIEVLARVERPVEGTWLLEGLTERSPALIACALVTPSEGKVSVRLLNPRAKRVVVHSGREIAVLEEDEEPISAVHDMPTQKPSQEILNLRELVNRSGKELDATQKEEFYHLLLEFREIFAATSADLGRTDKIKHDIYTGKAPPVRQQVCRIPPSRRSEMKQLVQDLLQRRVIQESSSP